MSAKQALNSARSPPKPVTRQISVVELLRGHGARFVLEEQGGLVDVLRNLQDGHLAARGDSPRGDAVIEVHEDFAQVKNNGFGNSHIISSARPSQQRRSSFQSPAQGEFVGKLQPGAGGQAVSDAA